LRVSVGMVGSTSATVRQRFADVSTVDLSGKFDILLEQMGQVRNPDGRVSRCLIFANQRDTVDELQWDLKNSRIAAARLTSGMKKEDRVRAIRDFKDGKVHALVATDIAARGLDLQGVDHVINYDLPQQAEDYVHRVGRTGRIGNPGVATSLVSMWEPALPGIVDKIKYQESLHGSANQSAVPYWVEAQAREHLSRMARRSGSGGEQQRRGRRGDQYFGVMAVSPPEEKPTFSRYERKGAKGRGRGGGDRRGRGQRGRAPGPAGGSYGEGEEDGPRGGGRGDDDEPAWAEDLPPRGLGRIY